MRKLNLDTMTVEQLVARFADAAFIQYDAVLDNDIRKYNRLYDRQVEVREELRRRGSDERVALLSLYNHPNIQVRLQAASFTTGVAPKRARKLLQEIKDEQELPQSAEAGLTLRRLASSKSKPA